MIKPFTTTNTTSEINNINEIPDIENTAILIANESNESCDSFDDFDEAPDYGEDIDDATLFYEYLRRQESIRTDVHLKKEYRYIRTNGKAGKDLRIDMYSICIEDGFSLEHFLDDDYLSASADGKTYYIEEEINGERVPTGAYYRIISEHSIPSDTGYPVGLCYETLEGLENILNSLPEYSTFTAGSKFTITDLTPIEPVWLLNID